MAEFLDWSGQFFNDILFECGPGLWQLIQPEMQAQDLLWLLVSHKRDSDLFSGQKSPLGLFNGQEGPVLRLPNNAFHMLEVLAVYGGPEDDLILARQRNS